MAEKIERVRFLVPGTPASLEAWKVGSLDPSIEVEWVENDGTFGQAFSFGTVAPDIVETIDAVPGALVLYSSVGLREGRRQIVTAVERLRDAGAVAVRIEQSKLGWDVARWLELFSSDDPFAWHRGAVAMLDGKTSVQSCGMHAFSLPDVQVPLDVDRRQLHQLASMFNVYQLAEDPILLSGQTFTPERETPRRVLERWPDLEYPPGHTCHNPYGVWRLGPPGGTARPVRELVPTFIPTLNVLLTALESKQGAPLTKQQVETIRDQGVCIAMNPRDVQALERERGYADLEPELAWEQWQAMRANR